jgi:hypothetical protein
VVLASIDVGLLFEVVWASTLAGIVVSILFALVVVFGSRSAEARRGGAGGASMAYALLALLSIAAFGVVVGYGVQIMLSKG